MSGPLAAELATVLDRLKRAHDVLPFLGQLLPASEVRLAPLRGPMLDQLRTSPDFTSIRPGAPVWLSLGGPEDEMAELVVYRAEANGQHYVIAPQAE
jgi:hypothetical protein